MKKVTRPEAPAAGELSLSRRAMDGAVTIARWLALPAAVTALFATEALSAVELGSVSAGEGNSPLDTFLDELSDASSVID